MANKTYMLGATSGWTKDEIKMEAALRERLGATRSNLFRSLVRGAFTQSEGKNYQLVSVIGLEIDGAELIPVVAPAPATFAGGKDAAKQ